MLHYFAPKYIKHSVKMFVESLIDNWFAVLLLQTRLLSPFAISHPHVPFMIWPLWINANINSHLDLMRWVMCSQKVSKYKVDFGRIEVDHLLCC